MGWSSSVSIMQEVAERVALRRGAPQASQLVRGRALPPFLTSCIAWQGQGHALVACVS